MFDTQSICDLGVPLCGRYIPEIEVNTGRGPEESTAGELQVVSTAG